MATIRDEMGTEDALIDNPQNILSLDDSNVIASPVKGERIASEAQSSPITC